MQFETIGHTRRIYNDTIFKEPDPDTVRPNTVRAVDSSCCRLGCRATAVWESGNGRVWKLLAIGGKVGCNWLIVSWLIGRCDWQMPIGPIASLPN